MKQRLCGREQEFGISINPSEELVKEILDSVMNVAPGLYVQSSHPYSHFPHGVMGMPLASAVWLKNGSKAYIDQGLLELATAECVAGSLDLLAQEKANEKILNQALELIRQKRKLPRLALYKNNVGLRIPDPVTASPPRQPKEKSAKKADLMDEVSYGSHHNYSYLLEKQVQILETFNNFIPIALLLSGNGHIIRGSSAKCVFGFSQRARHIFKAIGDNPPTENHRRFIVDDSRQESLSGKAEHLGRLHLISRDATRCEFQTWLVDSITHLVLRLAEEGWRLPKEYRLFQPISELQKLNFSIDFDYRVTAVSGKDMNIIKYNKIFLKAAKQLKPLSDMERKCLGEWQRVLDLLEAGELRPLVGELDWVTKWYLLVNAMKKGGFGLDSARAWAISMNYHDISASPEQSGFARLDEAGKIRHLISSSDINRAASVSPITRAKDRSYLIDFCLKNPDFSKRLVYLDWDRVCIQSNGDKVIYFGEKDNPALPQPNFGSTVRTLQPLTHTV